MVDPVTRFFLDRSYRRPADGPTIIGGSPLRLFRLGPAGERVITAIERGDDAPEGHGSLTDRLVDAGVLHPDVALDPVDPALVTVVIPARLATPRCLTTTSWSARVVVVDDASPTPLAVPKAEVIRLDQQAGPGGARNAGLAAVTTPYVAFIDTDVAIDEHDVLRLAAHLLDSRVALVAPRIVADRDAGVLARFEERHSPLDLGDEPARIAATTRVSYVPAAALVCRTEALRSIGGFDAGLRYGEDVDLVWRLAEAGWRCRYEPSVLATHATRSTMAAWLEQRFRYGTSAAALDARHPGALAPLRMSPWSAGAWAAVVAGWPVVGVLIGAGTSVALARKLRPLPSTESLRLAGTGHVAAGRLVASTVTRTWWPIAVLAALVSRRARWVLAAAITVPAALAWRERRPSLDPVRYTALRVADDGAYGAGVWWGAWRERRPAVLFPAFEAWPPRERGD